MPFNFLPPGPLADDQLQLHLRLTEQPEVSFCNVPWYRFEIQRIGTGIRIGHINLRIGDGLTQLPQFPAHKKNSLTQIGDGAF